MFLNVLTFAKADDYGPPSLLADGGPSDLNQVSVGKNDQEDRNSKTLRPGNTDMLQSHPNARKESVIHISIWQVHREDATQHR